MKNKVEMKALSLRIPKEQYDAIIEVAEDNTRSFNGQARVIFAEYLFDKKMNERR